MGQKVAEIVTNRVIEALDKGTIPWVKPWHSVQGLACNYVTKRKYSGFNAFILNFCYDYAVPYYLTLNQANKYDAILKEGEKRNGIPVIFWAFIPAKDQKTGKPIFDKAGKPKKVGIMRFYTVYNVSQFENGKFKIPTFEPSKIESIEACENVVKAYTDKPCIVHDGSNACYSPSQDKVSMPNKESFRDSEYYYRTLFHELAHSTGHESRLDRKLTVTDKESYAKEELVAELATAMLCHNCHILNHIDNEAAYIDYWLAKLRNDRSLLIRASSLAEKAMNHMLKIVPEAFTPNEETEEKEAVTA
jgi:antirestriction protein ArdC